VGKTVRDHLLHHGDTEGTEKIWLSLGFTGTAGGDMPPLCGACPMPNRGPTPLIHQIHITAGPVFITAGPVFCELVEKRLFPRDTGYI